jgi:type 1 glutamine amidotransferase
MTNQVHYPGSIAYTSTNAPGKGESLPGFTLEHSEVYLNHVHSGPRTLLMGLKFTDPKTGATYMQDRAGWIKPAGKGTLIYLMPGHTTKDFENPAYGRIVLNAVIYKS